jgi:tRNA-splicing ligase RtcB
MNTRDLAKIGIPPGPCTEMAIDLLQQAHAAKHDMTAVVDDLTRVAAAPAGFIGDERYGPLAQRLIDDAAAARTFRPRERNAPYRIWGANLEPEAVQQLTNACKLPVAVAGALMPDAHVGYGLPIGGVLATSEAVIPYAVGVDIACRMKMTVLDLPVNALADQHDRLTGALERETRFGMGATFRSRHQHDVMDREWAITPVTSKMKDRAWAQLGTSGSGNHFVEFGELTVLDETAGLPRGRYLALLSHSGSRGTGAQVAQHYSRLARELHPELPRELSHLAWLDLSRPGRSTGRRWSSWAAMRPRITS